MRLLLILLTVFSAANAADFVTEKPIVVKVIDGDTIKVKYENGDTENIRLIGIDAPENKYTKKGDKDPIGGPLAKEHLELLIEDAPVILEIYPGDNLPSYVFLPVNEEPGKMSHVNLRMVKDGYAIADSEEATDHKYDDDFKKAEEDAKTAKRGLWGTDKVYLTTTREVYHVTGCQYLEDVESPEAISRLEALREGIEPCEICQGK